MPHTSISAARTTRLHKVNVGQSKLIELLRQDLTQVDVCCVGVIIIHVAKLTVR